MTINPKIQIEILSLPQPIVNPPMAKGGGGGGGRLGVPPSGFSSFPLEWEELLLQTKGLVKLMQRVKIAHLFLQFVSNQFHFIILSLLM